MMLKLRSADVGRWVFVRGDAVLDKACSDATMKANDMYQREIVRCWRCKWFCTRNNRALLWRWRWRGLSAQEQDRGWPRESGTLSGGEARKVLSFVG